MEASVDNVEEDLAVDANQNTEEDKDGEDEGGDQDEDDEDFEMLDMLCDAVEVDDYQANKQKELKQMNQIMDARQKERDTKK